MSNLLWQMQRCMDCVIVEQGSGLTHKIAAPAELAKEGSSAREKAEHGMSTPP